MDYKTLFSQTPPTRLFFKAAIPGSIGMLASALYQVADGIFISRILGDTAFAGFNLAMPLVIINFALADLIGLGSAVPISIKLGSKDEKEANNYFTCASIMVVLAGILSGAVLALGGRTFLSWMGAQGELLDQATQYLVTYALCSPVTTIVFAVDNYLRGRHVLSVNSLGGLKTACVEGEPDARIPAGLEISPMGLQDYFISLMNEEDVK